MKKFSKHEQIWKSKCLSILISILFPYLHCLAIHKLLFVCLIHFLIIAPLSTNVFDFITYRNLVSQALNDSSLQNQPYIVHTIKTEHILGNKVMMHATDMRSDIPIVIINLSKDEVIGRVSIPLKYTNDEFRAKHLGDAFNNEFDGKCIHDGNRYDTSVCDFRLNIKLVNDEQLNSISKRVGQMIKNLFK